MNDKKYSITTAELSAITNLTAERLRQLSKAGHFAPPCRGVWDLADVTHGLVEHLQDRLKARRDTPETIAARQEKAQTDAELAKLKLSEKKNTTLSLDAVEKAWASHIVSARQILQRSSLPPAELKKVLAELVISATEYTDK